MDAVLSREALSGVATGDAVARHVIESGGKRIRPAVFFLAARTAPDGHPAVHDVARLAEIAAALEMVHTASLLHDDVVDGDNLRRGRASANAAFGNGASVLVGDFLWCAASRLIVSAGIPRLTDAVVSAVRATAIGALLEIECKGTVQNNRGSWLKVIEGKTAELFALCARAGAIVAGAEGRHEEALASYGRSVGMAFQLTDDAMDAASDDCNSQARQGIELFGGANAALELARTYAKDAKQHLTAIPHSSIRESLMGLADYSANRES